MPLLGLGAWLASMMGPLLARVLIAAGLSVVSVVGVTASITAIKDMLLANLQLVPAAGLQLALLGGAGSALGMIFGAITFRLLLWQVANTRRILSSST